jgi:hypothetical protein
LEDDKEVTMTKRRVYLARIALLALGATAATRAEAAFVAIFQEVGPNDVEVGGGTFDLTDLTLGETGAISTPGVLPQLAFFDSGDNQAPVFTYLTVTTPTNFGPGVRTNASSSSGDVVAISSIGLLNLPFGYVSGKPLSDTSTYLDATFASLGMTPGSYVYSWGSGDHADTLTVNIVASPVPEPSTWAMMLVGFAGLGYAAVRRKGALRSAPT